MTPTDLETLRGLVKLARKVTQGPWHSYWRTGGDTTDCGVTSERGYAVYRAPRYQNEKQWKADGDFAVAMQAAIPALTALLDDYEKRSKPIDCLLFCPECGFQHIDAPEPGSTWTNPPHRKHLCHKCGALWYAAAVPTNGITWDALRATLAGESLLMKGEKA